jgi:uncharacterized protein
MTTLPTRTLGKTGLTVSAVGFGGIPIMRHDHETAVSIVTAALDAGVTFIDTAIGYGDSHTKIGAAIAGRRDGLVIASKSGASTKADMARDIKTARRDLGIDTIDIFQLHGVSLDSWETIRAPGGALEALIDAKAAGTINHIGFSSHDVDCAVQLAREPIFETVQFPFNLVTHEPADELIPIARENDLVFIVMKPMCGGQFDDADLAFKFLNSYPDLVAIPGIENAAEIEQITQIVASGETLTGDELTRAQDIADRLGKVFCRRCGYCQPCPQGIGITTAIVFSGLARRFTVEGCQGIAKGIIESTPKCTECGECITKCPYDLPIPDLLKDARAFAETFLTEHPAD